MKSFLFVAFCCALSPSAGAQDGPTLIKRMYAAYAGLSSYRHQASSTVTTSPGRPVGSVSEVRYSRPGRIYLSSTNPTEGTLTASLDGREFVFYRSQTNTYQKKPVPAGKVNRIPCMPWNVLFYVQGLKADALISRYTARGMANINGAACYQVVGTLKPSLVSKGTGQITYWIERNTGLLRKIRTDIRGVPALMPRATVRKGKQATEYLRIKVDRSMTEVIQEMQVNPVLKDADFRITLPRGAIEQDPDRLLGRKK